MRHQLPICCHKFLSRIECCGSHPVGNVFRSMIVIVFYIQGNNLMMEKITNITNYYCYVFLMTNSQHQIFCARKRKFFSLVILPCPDPSPHSSYWEIWGIPTLCLWLIVDGCGKTKFELNVNIIIISQICVIRYQKIKNT